MSLIRLLFFIVFIIMAIPSIGQKFEHDSSAGNLISNNDFNSTDSGIYIISKYRTSCKGYSTITNFIPNPPIKMIQQQVPVAAIVTTEKRIKFLTVHGNVSYDYFYRSNVDTPFNQQNFQQHTERVSLDILLKEKYPFKINFASRQSNSPFFRDFIDINFNFDRYNYNHNLKQQLIGKLKAQVPDYTRKFNELTSAQEELKKYQNTLDNSRKWLDDPGTLQKIIEEREKLYYQKLQNAVEDKEKAYFSKLQAGKDSLNGKNEYKTFADSIRGKTAELNDKLTDSLKTIQSKLVQGGNKLAANVTAKSDSLSKPFLDQYNKEQKKLDSLNRKVEYCRKRVDSLQKLVQNDIASVKQKIYAAKNEKELRKLADENCIQIDKQSKLEKRLAAIKSFGIGRSILNYTELTAQNITVTGINVEYNPSYYVAVCAGKIDYRFRDFYNKTGSHNNQYIVMGRVGIGDKENKAVIFSYFTGRKDNNNYGINDSIKNTVNLMGYSVEAIYKKDENTFITAEFAKSTKPVTGDLRSGKQTGALVKFNDQSNMGINFKAQTIFPETHTSISGFFRKTGENFQSFSLFSYNTNQTAWLARVDQLLFKDKVTVTGMLRRNDFTNPFSEKTYKTSTVFKSIQLTVRFPKYPCVSIGYYPGTQLYILNKEKIRESAYYILNGSATYSYLVKGLMMNSTVVYNHYSSQATDSGFIPYKGVNYYASQTLRLRKMDLHGGYAYTRQSMLTYSTLEASCEYAFINWFRAGVGLKYNIVEDGSKYWGECISIKADFKKFGGLQLQYERSHLPTINGGLAAVEIGRVGYYKRF